MTAPQPVTTAVFDLGGVLIDWRREFLYEQLIPDPERRTWFLDTICSLEWNADGDRGRPFAELIAERTARFPDQAELIAAYWERWDEMSGPAIADTVQILVELQQRAVPTYALTNWSAETLPRVRHRYPFLEAFDGMLVSGEEGVIKPDPTIYLLLCERFGLRPEDTFFVDDSAANVDAAAAMGFTAHRYTSADALRAALEETGLVSR
jgi:2-haloacid dehalogenase